MRSPFRTQRSGAGSSGSASVSQYAKTARAIVGRVSELLHAQVFALDQQGVVVASSDEQLGWFSWSNKHEYLQVPLQVGNQTGKIVVGTTNEEMISPRLARVLIELVINQTTILERLPNRQSLKDRFIYDLLHGNSIDEEQVFQQAKLLNLNLLPPRAVILVDAADYILADEETEGDRQHRRAQLIIGTIVNFFHLPDDTICADLKNGKVAILKASNTKNMGKWAQNSEPPSAWANLTALKRASDSLLRRLRCDTNTSISIGIGRYHPGVRGVARSYEDARAALTLGHRFNGRNQVYCLDQLGIAAFVCITDEQTKVELATHLLSPLDCEPELLETLKVFFEQDCCPSATAKQLSVHRNTLSYRLEKVTSLTGLSPRCFDDAVQMRLALLLRCGAQPSEPMVLSQRKEFKESERELGFE